MKKLLNRVVGITAMATMLFSCTTAFAAPGTLPETMDRDGKVYTIDRSAGGGPGTATPDFENVALFRAYQVLGSDVALYIDYGNGHGGDYYAAGWVQTTAPSFTAKAEVWANGRLEVTGPNFKNKGDIAEAISYTTTGLVENATPRIFYSW